jgi:hypothetical protein
VDRVGEAILEHLICMMEHEIHILGPRKLRETVATPTWYLWYERRKLTHGEETQRVVQIDLAVRGGKFHYLMQSETNAESGWLGKAKKRLCETKH